MFRQSISELGDSGIYQTLKLESEALNAIHAIQCALWLLHDDFDQLVSVQKKEKRLTYSTWANLRGLLDLKTLSWSDTLAVFVLLAIRGRVKNRVERFLESLAVQLELTFKTWKFLDVQLESCWEVGCYEQKHIKNYLYAAGMLCMVKNRWNLLTWKDFGRERTLFFCFCVGALELPKPGLGCQMALESSYIICSMTYDDSILTLHHI